MELVMSKFGIKRFSKDEDGSILIFILVVFMTIVFVGGTAIDLSRHETMRATMQYNLDRAVLAAASMKQTKVPDAVVDDYMSKVSSIEEISVATIYDTGLNFRTVSSTATASLNTMFMSMAGIETMPITVTSAAEERIPKLEISLVLDVSGSMADDGKMVNLKAAAKTFVSTMLAGADPNKVAISIVPFSTSVTPSEEIYEALNVDEKHTYSRCIHYSDADYSTLEVDPVASLDQSIYTARYGGWENFANTWDTCITEEYHEILPYSQNESDLHTKIDSLVAYSGTSANIGMKWGTALLDPKFASVVTSLITDLEVDAGLAAVPALYSDVDTLKVVVLMGDGQNTVNHYFEEHSDFRGHNSNLWQVVAEPVFQYLTYYGTVYTGAGYEVYCSWSTTQCFYSEPTTYYLRKPSTNTLYNITDDSWITMAEFNALPSTLPGFVSRERYSWELAWGLMTPQYYGNITGDYSAYYEMDGNRTDIGNGGHTGSEENTLLLANCTAARESNQVVVYTIGFEVAVNGVAETTLQACASTPSHYYAPTGSEISGVFSAIATSIQKLKLTQ